MWTGFGGLRPNVRSVRAHATVFRRYPRDRQPAILAPNRRSHHRVVRHLPRSGNGATRGSFPVRHSRWQTERHRRGFRAPARCRPEAGAPSRPRASSRLTSRPRASCAMRSRCAARSGAGVNTGVPWPARPIGVVAVPAGQHSSRTWLLAGGPPPSPPISVPGGESPADPGLRGAPVPHVVLHFHDRRTGALREIVQSGVVVLAR